MSNINMLADINVEVSVEFAKTKVKLADIARLDRGAVIDLVSDINKPLNIYVQNKLFAKGEAVVLDDGKAGVRILSIVGRDE